MRSFLLLLALLSLAFCVSLKWSDLQQDQKHRYTFDDFKVEFNRHYATEDEEAFRRVLFEERLEKVHRHNANPSKTWKEGVHKRSDWTAEEFKALRGLKHLPKHLRSSTQLPEHLFKNVDVSSFANVNVDWRTKGVVTKPKDQGACGSCWTFATTETIESYNALATKNLLTLSEQQILDCTPNPDGCGGTGGCGGGTVELAVARITAMGGLTNESNYPYKSRGGQNFKCDMTKFKPAVKVSGYVDLPSNKLAPVLQHLTNVGPLAISVDASTWSDYESGVFNGCNNVSPDLDHAVQCVGYGTDAAYGDYWLVRNSWGEGYGENGYIRIKRYSSPPCGVDHTPGDGDGCNGGPSSVVVCGNCGILFDTTYVNIAK